MVSDKKKAYLKQWRLDNKEKIKQYKLDNPKCNVKYGKYLDGSGTWKCMDHDHTPGLENNFRNILCSRCNVNLTTKNKSGTPNVSKKRYGWEYKRTINGKRHRKCFKYYYDAIVYKYLYEYFNFY